MKIEGIHDSTRYFTGKSAQDVAAKDKGVLRTDAVSFEEKKKHRQHPERQPEAKNEDSNDGENATPLATADGSAGSEVSRIDLVV